MFKTCDDCGNSFDIFKEGYGHQFFVVCGNCWTIETKRRETGGVFTRGGK
jgi:ssDNA-binding Zn-finger/Zn-ribbon topoisomerase 1